MVPFLFFLVALVLWGAISWTLSALGMRGPWQREGPARIADAVRRRNRIIVLAVLAFLVVVAFLEAVSYDVHEHGLMALQYGMGDAVDADPVGVYQTGSGGVSWALYLSVLLGTVLGLMLGSWACLKRFAITSTLSPSRLS